VTKIVGGSARGRTLRVPTAGTRPTSQRAREALFNTIRSHLDLAGARFLDLFAGSGAVGLEALSNGAAAVVLVEQNLGACAVIRANAESLGLPGATVIARSAHSYLASASVTAAFDVIFADPPYAMPAAELAELMVVAAGLLTVPGLLVVERAARTGELLLPAELTPLKNRRYGEAMLWYGRREQHRSSSELA
jgi:16S rRNA (guanine966-N2)-methyltransferase